ncbi:hypothetical protein N0V83_004209 [Neocucurbitaria cava]|uniref:Uncharacterized protein n=1 Tax=Neocucurbitaria cava TaxID=798079 RepID=A0A9W8YB45_9PLEO|nr:hypothetical protein N0V83_004209 [Neocucurbitaria cava]
MSKYQKKVKVLEKIAHMNETGQGVLPERPNLSFFSEILEAKPGLKSPYLVLDEVNAVKNSTRTTMLWLCFLPIRLLLTRVILHSAVLNGDSTD